MSDLEITVSAVDGPVAQRLLKADDVEKADGECRLSFDDEETRESLDRLSGEGIPFIALHSGGCDEVEIVEAEAIWDSWPLINGEYVVAALEDGEVSQIDLAEFHKYLENKSEVMASIRARKPEDTSNSHVERMSPEEYIRDHAEGAERMPCPACGIRSIRRSPPALESDCRIRMYVACLACGSNWTEEYRLSGVNFTDLAPSEE